MDDVFEFFKDCNWHSLEEVQTKFGIDVVSVRQIVDFFTASGFLKFDEERNSAIMQSNVKQTLKDDD